MSTSFIHYDRPLPEVANRYPWRKPISYLVKDRKSDTGWREEKSGRRPSDLLLVPKIRAAVDAWRKSGYEGASEVTRRLFHYWFEEDHDVLGFDAPLRYYFCQREAVETLAWLVEMAKASDVRALIEQYCTVTPQDQLLGTMAFETTMDGRRQLRRCVPELGVDRVYNLPPENLRRFAFKMATGAGKTWVMAMAIVWMHFHKQCVPGSPLSENFLIVAPNVIVYQRLEKDFADNRIFYRLPLIPPEWRARFAQKVTLRGETTEPGAAGNLFLTNIQQLYESRGHGWDPANVVEALLGPKPKLDLAASGQRSMLERIKSLSDLVVLNDEAHHVHDEDLKWSRSLLSVHDTLPQGLAAWLDFSATPKDQNGLFFPWTVCDYPLAQAVEDRIVKAPIIVTREGDPLLPADDPIKVTKKNAVEKYGYWVRAAVARWKEHARVYGELGIKPVLFVMAELSAHADALGEYLHKTKEFGFEPCEVLVIHTDGKGTITKKDLEAARRTVRNIDQKKNKIKAIVSVMMLREGWDVRNVTVVLGLRPFTAKAEILPEQVIGRGLRLMAGIGPDRTQTLEVLGTRKLLDVLREQLEADGVGVNVTKDALSTLQVVRPVREKLAHDIAIPITKPSLRHDIRKLDGLDVHKLDAIIEQGESHKHFRDRLKMEFATTETTVHEADVAADDRTHARSLLASITQKVILRARLPNRFAQLYPVVQTYVVYRCFGQEVDLDDEAPRSHLTRPELQEGIAKYLARKIAELTVERHEIDFECANFDLSETKPFSWRRNLPLLSARKTVFNRVATYNDFEKDFARFLDQAGDVARFAALGTTEQGASGTRFRIDYLKPSGAIGFYFPDWIAVQEASSGEVVWIIETKGRVWVGTEAKDEAAREWCRQVSRKIGARWKYLRVNQDRYQNQLRLGVRTLRELAEACFDPTNL